MNSCQSKASRYLSLLSLSEKGGGEGREGGRERERVKETALNSVSTASFVCFFIFGHAKKKSGTKVLPERKEQAK